MVPAQADGEHQRSRIKAKSKSSQQAVGMVCFVVSKTKTPQS
jgi:hypothetical protein